MAMFKRDKSWYVDYYFGSRRIRECVGSSKGEAIQALSSRQTDIARRAFKLPPRTGAPTFAVFAAKYLELVSVHKRSHAVERYIIGTLTRCFGKYRISDLTAEDTERFKSNRSRHVKPATVNRELTVLKSMFSKAVEWDLLISSPFKGVRYLRVPSHIERVLTADEEQKLLSASGDVRTPYLKDVITLALNTGMRKSELLGLEMVTNRSGSRENSVAQWEVEISGANHPDEREGPRTSNKAGPKHETQSCCFPAFVNLERKFWI